MEGGRAVHGSLTRTWDEEEGLERSWKSLANGDLGALGPGGLCGVGDSGRSSSSTEFH